MLRSEPLATLGDSLALCPPVVRGERSVDARSSTSAPTRTSRSDLIEVDAQGRGRRVGVLRRRQARRRDRAPLRTPRRAAPRRPRSARAPRRRRVRSRRCWDRPISTRYGTAFAQDVEVIDHRTVGFGSAAAAPMRYCAASAACSRLSDDLAVRVDDVLGLDSDAVLMRWTISGTDPRRRRRLRAALPAAVGLRRRRSA